MKEDEPLLVKMARKTYKALFAFTRFYWIKFLLFFASLFFVSFSKNSIVTTFFALISTTDRCNAETWLKSLDKTSKKRRSMFYKQWKSKNYEFPRFEWRWFAFIPNVSSNALSECKYTGVDTPHTTTHSFTQKYIP